MLRVGGVRPHARERLLTPPARRGPPKIRFGRRPAPAVLPPPSFGILPGSAALRPRGGRIPRVSLCHPRAPSPCF
eukprot:scaffold180334_cov31-Tisochrysis_lutea.AAC.1